MPKALTRLVALLLIPGLLVDPVMAHTALEALHSPPITISLQNNPTETEAFMVRGLFDGRPTAMHIKTPSKTLASSYRKLKLAAAGMGATALAIAAFNHHPSVATFGLAGLLGYLHLLPAGAPPDAEVLSLVQSYYRIKQQLRDAFIAGHADAYKVAYHEMQKIERAAGEVLSQPDGHETLVHAAQLVQETDEFKGTYGGLSSDEIVHSANRDFSGSARRMIHRSAEWLTRLAVDLPAEQKETAQKLTEASESICLTRLIPSHITDGEPSPQEIENFQASLHIPSAMGPAGIRAMVFDRPDAPTEQVLLVDPNVEPEQLQPFWRHEAIHFLAGLGQLPISPMNETVTSIVDATELVRSQGLSALRRVGEGTQLALFNRGRRLFQEGGSIVDMQGLFEMAREAAIAHAKATPDLRTETEKRQAEQSQAILEEHATIGMQSSVERCIGYLVAGYLWDKAQTILAHEDTQRWPHLLVSPLGVQDESLDRSIFDYMRQVVSLEMPRQITIPEAQKATDRFYKLFERANLLVSLTGDSAVRAEPWTPLWPGDRPSWRYLLDQESGKPLHIFQYVPEDLLRRDDRMLRGFVYNQVFRALYSFQVLPEALRKDVYLWALWNQIEPLRVLPDGLNRWSGVEKAIQQVYDDRFALVKDPAVHARFQTMVPYVQFLEASAYEAWTGEIDRRVTNAQVKSALESTREARQQAVASATAEESLRVLQNQVYPALTAIIEESHQQLLEQHVQQRQLAEQAVQEFLNQLTPEQHEQLMQAIERELMQQIQQMAQQSGTSARPDAMQPLFEPGSNQLPEPGHEQSAQAGSMDAETAGQLSQSASAAGQKAGGIASRSGQLAQMTREAGEAAGQVAEGAEALRQQAGDNPDLSNSAGQLAQEAAKLVDELKNLQKEAQALDTEGEQLSQQGDKLQNQDGPSASELAKKAHQLAAQLAGLRAKAEAALQKQAQPLQAHVDLLHKRIANQEAEASTPDKIRHQAHEAKQQAQQLEEKLEALAQKAREAETSAEQTSQTAKQVAEQLSSASQNQPVPQSTGPLSPTERLRQQEAGKTDIPGQELIRPLPAPPPTLTQIPSKPVPREDETIQATAPKEDPAKLRQAAKKEKQDREKELAARAGLTAEQLKIVNDYLNPIRPHVSLIRAFFQRLFEPIYQAIREQGHRRGRLTRHHLARAVIEDRPRIYSRPGSPAIPRIRWSLIVDGSSSMLDDKEGITHSASSHDAIKGTKLAYAGQTAMLFQESLMDGQGQPLPGHETEIVYFTDADRIPETGGWAVLKDFVDRWTPRTMIKVLDQILNLPHGSTDDYTALVATLERAKGQIDEHIVIVVTDGGSSQGLAGKIAGIRKKYPKAKIFGVGVGPGAKEVEETYKPLGIWVEDISQLPQAVREVIGKEVKRIVDQWNSRRARFSISWLRWGLFVIGAVIAVPLLWLHPEIFIRHPDFSFFLVGLAAAGGRRPPASSGASAPQASQLWEDKAAQELQQFIDEHPDDRKAQLEKLYELFTRDLPGKVSRGAGGPRVPEEVEIYPLGQNIKLLQDMELISRFETLPYIYLWGPHGSGKNYILELWAASRNQGLTVLPAHGDMEEDEIFERQETFRVPDPKGGAPVTSTKWELTEFANALIRGDIVAWDEFREMPDNVRKKMNSVLQSGRFERQDATIITFHPDAKVVALSNPDDGQISGEMIDRFTHMEVKYLPPLQEEAFLQQKAPGLSSDIIHRLVNVATEIRAAKKNGIELEPISTRELGMLVQHLERFPEDQKHIPYVFRQVYLPPDDRPDLQTKVDEYLDAQGFRDEERVALTSSDWEIFSRKVGTGKDQREETFLRIGTVEAPIYGADKHVVGQVLKDYEKQSTNLLRLQDLLKDVILGQDILIEGDMGTGKDWALEILFYALKWPLFQADMNEKTLADDLLGHVELVENTQVWRPGKTAQAVENDGANYLSEVNGSKQGTQAAIHNFMQTRRVRLTNGVEIDARRKKHVLVLASANPNRPPYKVFPMGVAFRSRFKKHRYDYLPYVNGVPEKQEEVNLLQGFRPQVPREVADRLVKAANKLREKYRAGTGDLPLAVTPRTLKKVVQVLSANPALYSGRQVVDWFLRAYGISALPVSIQDLVKQTIERVLTGTDVRLNQIEDLQPLTGDAIFDQALKKWLAAHSDQRAAVVGFFQRCPLPASGNATLDRYLRSFLDPNNAGYAVKNIKPLREELARWAKTSPSDAHQKNIEDILQALADCPFIPKSAQKPFADLEASISSAEPGKTPMADRFGAPQILGRTSSPFITGEVPPEELAPTLRRALQILPHLQDIFVRIAHVWYADPSTMHGAGMITRSDEQPGHYEMVLDERYKDLSPEGRALVILMHLAHETQEAELTPANEDFKTHINREIVAMAAQARLYYSMTDSERSLLKQTVEKVQEPERYTSVLAFYDRWKTLEKLLSDEGKTALIKFLEGYPDEGLKGNLYEPTTVEPHFVKLLEVVAKAATDETLALALATIPGGQQLIQDLPQLVVAHMNRQLKEATSSKDREPPIVQSTSAFKDPKEIIECLRNQMHWSVVWDSNNITDSVKFVDDNSLHIHGSYMHRSYELLTDIHRALEDAQPPVPAGIQQIDALFTAQNLPFIKTKDELVKYLVDEWKWTISNFAETLIFKTPSFSESIDLEFVHAPQATDILNYLLAELRRRDPKPVEAIRPMEVLLTAIEINEWRARMSRVPTPASQITEPSTILTTLEAALGTAFTELEAPVKEAFVQSMNEAVAAVAEAISTQNSSPQGSGRSANVSVAEGLRAQKSTTVAAKQVQDNSWEAVSEPIELQEKYQHLAINPDGKWLALSRGLHIDIVDKASLKMLKTLSHSEGVNYVNSLAFSPEGAFLAAGGDSGLVNIWDLNGPDQPEAFRKSRHSVYHVGLSIDAKYAAIIDNQNNKVIVWNTKELNDDESRTVAQLSAHIGSSIAFSPSQSNVLAVTDAAKSLNLYDVGQRHITPYKTFPLKGAARSIHFTPDGKNVILEYDTTIEIRNIEAPTDVPTQILPAGPATFSHALSIDSGGKTLLQVGILDDKLQQWQQPLITAVQPPSAPNPQIIDADTIDELIDKLPETWQKATIWWTGKTMGDRGVYRHRVVSQWKLDYGDYYMEIRLQNGRYKFYGFTANYDDQGKLIAESDSNQLLHIIWHTTGDPMFTFVFDDAIAHQMKLSIKKYIRVLSKSEWEQEKTGAASPQMLPQPLQSPNHKVDNEKLREAVKQYLQFERHDHSSIGPEGEQSWAYTNFVQRFQSSSPSLVLQNFSDINANIPAAGLFIPLTAQRLKTLEPGDLIKRKNGLISIYPGYSKDYATYPSSSGEREEIHWITEGSLSQFSFYRINSEAPGLEADSIENFLENLPSYWVVTQNSLLEKAHWKAKSFEGITVRKSRWNKDWKIEFDANNHLEYITGRDGVSYYNVNGVIVNTGTGDRIVHVGWKMDGIRPFGEITLVLDDDWTTLFDDAKTTKALQQHTIEGLRILSKSEWEPEKTQLRHKIIHELLRVKGMAKDSQSVFEHESPNIYTTLRTIGTLIGIKEESHKGDLLVVISNLSGSAKVEAAGILRGTYIDHRYDIDWPGQPKDWTTDLSSPNLETYRLATGDELKKLGFSVETTLTTLANPSPAEPSVDQSSSHPAIESSAVHIESAVRDLLQTPTHLLPAGLLETLTRAATGLAKAADSTQSVTTLTPAPEMSDIIEETNFLDFYNKLSKAEGATEEIKDDRRFTSFLIEGFKVELNQLRSSSSIYFKETKESQQDGFQVTAATRLIWVPQQGSVPALLTTVFPGSLAWPIQKRSGQTWTGARWRVFSESEWKAEKQKDQAPKLTRDNVIDLLEKTFRTNVYLKNLQSDVVFDTGESRDGLKIYGIYINNQLTDAIQVLEIAIQKVPPTYENVKEILIKKLAQWKASQSDSSIEMADRFGAPKTVGPVGSPFIVGEMPQEELEPLVQRAIQILPHLKVTLQKTTRVWYADPATLHGAVAISRSEDQSGLYEVILDERYQNLNPEARALVVLMHLAHEAQEALLTPDNEDFKTHINREIVAVAAQARLYYSMTDSERSLLKHTVEKFQEPERYIPVLALYDQWGTLEKLLSYEGKTALVKFLGEYTDGGLKSDLYQPAKAHSHFAKLLEATKAAVQKTLGVRFIEEHSAAESLLDHLGLTVDGAKLGPVSKKQTKASVGTVPTARPSAPLGQTPTTLTKLDSEIQALEIEVEALLNKTSWIPSYLGSRPDPSDQERINKARELLLQKEKQLEELKVRRTELEKAAAPGLTGLKEKLIQVLSANDYFDSPEGFKAAVAVEKELEHRFPPKTDMGVVWNQLRLQPIDKMDLKHGDIVLYRTGDERFLLYEINGFSENGRISIWRNSTIESVSETGNGEDGGSARLFVTAQEIAGRRAELEKEQSKPSLGTVPIAQPDAPLGLSQQAQQAEAVPDLMDQAIEFLGSIRELTGKDQVTVSVVKKPAAEFAKLSAYGEDIQSLKDLGTPVFIWRVLSQTYDNSGSLVDIEMVMRDDYDNPAGLLRSFLEQIKLLNDIELSSHEKHRVEDKIASLSKQIVGNRAELESIESRSSINPPLLKALEVLLNNALREEQKNLTDYDPTRAGDDLSKWNELYSLEKLATAQIKVLEQQIANLKSADTPEKQTSVIRDVLLGRRGMLGRRGLPDEKFLVIIEVEPEIRYVFLPSDHSLYKGPPIGTLSLEELRELRIFDPDNEKGFEPDRKVYDPDHGPATIIEIHEHQVGSEKHEIAKLIYWQKRFESNSSYFGHGGVVDLTLEPHRLHNLPPEAATSKSEGRKEKGETANIVTRLSPISSQVAAAWETALTAIVGTAAVARPLSEAISLLMQPTQGTTTAPLAAPPEVPASDDWRETLINILQGHLEGTADIKFTTRSLEKPVKFKWDRHGFNATINTIYISNSFTDLPGALSAVIEQALKEEYLSTYFHGHEHDRAGPMIKEWLDEALKGAGVHSNERIQELQSLLLKLRRRIKNADGFPDEKASQLFAQLRDELQKAKQPPAAPPQTVAELAKTTLDQLPPKIYDRLAQAYDNMSHAVANLPNLKRWEEDASLMELKGKNITYSGTEVGTTKLMVNHFIPGYEISIFDLNAKGEYIEYVMSYDSSAKFKKSITFGIVANNEDKLVKHLPNRSFLTFEPLSNGIQVVLTTDGIHKLGKMGFPTKIESSDGFVLSFISKEEYEQQPSAAQGQATAPQANFLEKLVKETIANSDWAKAYDLAKPYDEDGLEAFWKNTFPNLPHTNPDEEIHHGDIFIGINPSPWKKPYGVWLAEVEAVLDTGLKVILHSEPESNLGFITKAELANDTYRRLISAQELKVIKERIAEQEKAQAAVPPQADRITSQIKELIDWLNEKDLRTLQDSKAVLQAGKVYEVELTFVDDRTQDSKTIVHQVLRSAATGNPIKVLSEIKKYIRQYVLRFADTNNVDTLKQINTKLRELKSKEQIDAASLPAQSPSHLVTESPALLQRDLAVLHAALNLPIDQIPNGEQVLAKLVEAAGAWAKHGMPKTTGGGSTRRAGTDIEKQAREFVEQYRQLVYEDDPGGRQIYRDSEKAKKVWEELWSLPLEFQPTNKKEALTIKPGDLLHAEGNPARFTPELQFVVIDVGSKTLLVSNLWYLKNVNDPFHSTPARDETNISFDDLGHYKLHRVTSAAEIDAAREPTDAKTNLDRIEDLERFLADTFGLVKNVSLYSTLIKLPGRGVEMEWNDKKITHLRFTRTLSPSDVGLEVIQILENVIQEYEANYESHDMTRKPQKILRALKRRLEELEAAKEKATQARQQGNVLSKSIEELELPIPDYNLLSRANINTVGELVQYTESGLKQTLIPHKGAAVHAIKSVRQALATIGFSLKNDTAPIINETRGSAFFGKLAKSYNISPSYAGYSDNDVQTFSIAGFRFRLTIYKNLVTHLAIEPRRDLSQDEAIDIKDTGSVRRYIWREALGSEPAELTLVVADKDVSKFRIRSGKTTEGASWRILTKSEWKAEQVAKAKNPKRQKGYLVTELGLASALGSAIMATLFSAPAVLITAFHLAVPVVLGTLIWIVVRSLKTSRRLGTTVPRPLRAAA